MEIPLNAQVECTDGVCGRSVYVLINPVIDQVTHLVVKEDSFPNTKYIVPVEYVTETIADTIRLRCSKVELEQMDPFVQTEFVQEKVPDYREYRGGMSGIGSYYYMPYVIPEKTVYESVEHQQRSRRGAGCAGRARHVPSLQTPAAGCRAGCRGRQLPHQISDAHPSVGRPLPNPRP